MVYLQGTSSNLAPFQSILHITDELLLLKDNAENALPILKYPMQVTYAVKSKLTGTNTECDTLCNMPLTNLSSSAGNSAYSYNAGIALPDIHPIVFLHALSSLPIYSNPAQSSALKSFPATL